MNRHATIEQVAGILHRAELEFDTHSDGDSYRLLFEREAVFVHFDDWHDHTRVWLTSPALQRLDAEDAGYAVAMNKLNELNMRHRFVKWILDDGTLLAVHDVLGTDLAAAPLLNAVFALAGAAKNAADELEDATGGWRYDEIMAEAEVD